jgi:hypothetical protein
MKYYVGISTAIGLLLGLSTAYLAGASCFNSSWCSSSSSWYINRLWYWKILSES